MGLLKLFINGKYNRGDKELLPEEEGGKIYKIINMASVFGVLIALTILILSTFGIFKITSTLIGLVGTIFAICLALFLSLYWIKNLEKNQFKKVSLVFLVLIVVCAVLWIICIWSGIGLYRKVRDNDGEEIAKSLITSFNIIKVTFIFSLQFFIAAFIAENITKFGKTMLPVQVIAYVGYAYIDFYVTYFACCLSLSGDSIISPAAKLLVKAVPIMFLILSVLYVGVATGLLKAKRRKNLVKAIRDVQANQQTIQEENKQKETPAERLENLKDLLDKNIITQEEYDKKREEILKDM